MFGTGPYPNVTSSHGDYVKGQVQISGLEIQKTFLYNKILHKLLISMSDVTEPMQRKSYFLREIILLTVQVRSEGTYFSV